MSENTITIVVNGESLGVPAAETVRSLIERRGLGAGACAAEVNGKLVPRREHETRQLAMGDRVELVTLVGGG